MAEWSDVANNAIALAKEPKKLVRLIVCLSIIGLVVFGGLVAYNRSLAKKQDTPTSSQENNGDKNQSNGTNNGNMYQINK